MKMNNTIRHTAFAATCVACAATASAATADSFSLEAFVLSDDKLVSESTVSLWISRSKKRPELVSSTTSDKNGTARFKDIDQVNGDVFYLRSSGGKIKGTPVPQYETLAVLNGDQRATATLNEISTIGSLWPIAGMFDYQTGLAGTANGLLIGSSQVSNLVNVEQGFFGAVVLNGTNLTKSETVARINTLAALTALCGAELARQHCSDYLAITGSNSTLEALVKLATRPYQGNHKLFDLFTAAYPFPKGEQRRDTDFLPYLSYVPDDFSLMVRLVGGGTYSPGRLMFDNKGDLWSGQNWMPGSQSGLNTAIGGGVVRLGPSGQALSPALTGYNDQGLDGVGWGTTVSSDKVWVGTFNRKIGVFDLQGKALGPAKINGKIGGIQGLATAPNGDVWACDNQLNQMIRFPGGDHNRGEIVKVPGLKRPFAVAVNNNNIVWVTNNGADTVTRFPAHNPQKAQQVTVGIGPRGLGIDSKGNVWVGANMSPGYPLPKIPAGSSIIEEFKISLQNMKDSQKEFPVTGNLTMISPTGKVLKANLLNGQINTGWGVSIDGGDTVFIGNFFGTGFMHVCGEDTKHCPTGVKTGELIHAYRSGVLQESTDIMVDDAGNVWMANNWNVVDALVEDNPDRRTSTKGGGDGIVVIYGIGKPVVNPLIGGVRTPPTIH